MDRDDGAPEPTKTSIDRTRTSAGSPTRTSVGSRPAASATAFDPSIPPVENWDHYAIESYLGGGGMGRVYRAHDRRLGRPVALKFIRGDDQDAVARFMREAQAQARVDHDRVCKVYEVGEVEGKPYIAMQYIAGQPLHEAAARMSLEQKLRVVRGVAEGLHAAHREGLLHRDIKPSNIMVERTDSGEWCPYVMDFGLARSPGEAGMTVTGTVMGTPRYMSPEQARGEVRRLDRRSDVYSLGATMYELLTGHPPFAGMNPTEVLRKVIEDVPDTLRRSPESIPPDVEAITMKCLRKSPKERYGSARALAEDIGRYLDGEPVTARPTTFVYRLKMKARKHRIAVAVGAVAAVLLAGALAWGGFTWWSAAKRVRLAQVFGRDVERIEAIARYAHLLPLHDIRPERDRIRELMAAIEGRMAEAGRNGTGPGNYALGRGHLVLGDLERARDHLETAWNDGYREPEVAYAFGRVLGELYQQGLAEAQRISDEEARERREIELAGSLRDPALELLRKSRGVTTESPEYAEALLAFYEGRYELALAKASVAATDVPWLFEAHELRGQIHVALGRDASQRDHQAAVAAYRRAEAAYREALKIGESAPDAHVGLCEVGRYLIAAEINGPAVDVDPYFRLGLEGCRAALQVDPESTRAQVMTAGLHIGVADLRALKGEDPRESLTRAIETLRTAVERDASDERAYSYLGGAYRRVADYEKGHGLDPQGSLARSLEAYERALEISPRDPRLMNSIGNLYKSRALSESDRGEDPRASLSGALEAYRGSIRLAPGHFGAYFNLADAHLIRSGYLRARGEDGSSDIDAAADACRRGLEASPGRSLLLYQLGQVLHNRARVQMASGDDPLPTLAEAADAYGRAIESEPDSKYVPNFATGLGGIELARGQLAGARGDDPLPFFEKAIRAYSMAVERRPEDVEGLNSACFTHLLVADRLRTNGRDYREPATRAIAACERALAVNPRHPAATVNLGDAHRARAQALIRSGEDPGRDLHEARTALRRAVELNPGNWWAHSRLGFALMQEGRQRAASGENVDPLFAEALDAMARSAEVGGKSLYWHMMMARLHLWWARTQPTRGELVVRGLAHVDEVPGDAGESAEARAIRGALLLLRAETRPAGHVLAREARQNLADALAESPDLRPEYGDLLERADELAGDRS